MVYANNIIPEKYQDFAETIKQGWSTETSAYATWGETGIPPESGQCAVTALLIQATYGGTLKRALVNGASHYWNEIEGETIDLTRA